jgi:hypothetical protein
MSTYNIMGESPCPSLKFGMQSYDDNNESVLLRPDVINHYEHHSMEHRSLPDVCANSGVYPSVKLKHNFHQSNALKSAVSDVNPQELRTVNMTSTTSHITISDSNDVDVYDNTVYIVASSLIHDVTGLVDGGANGGLANPKEMRLLYYAEPSRRVNVTGVGDHDIPGLRIGTFAAKVITTTGKAILCIFHEYGELKTGKTIHSRIQLRDGSSQVYDDPERLGGKQCIETLEGHQIPLAFKNGLPYINMQFPTKEETTTLPHVIMTRDVPWDPTRYDKEVKVEESVQAGFDNDVEIMHDGFNQFGECIFDVNSGERIVPSTGEAIPEVTDPIYFAFHDGYEPTYYTEIYAHAGILANINYEVNFSQQTLAPIEYGEYRKYFLNVPATTVRHTFDCTTRNYRHIPATNHYMTFKSPYPANNVLRRHEMVATDTVFSDTVAWGGYTAAQVFVGKLSRYIASHPCKTDKDFPRTLEDEIRKRGAMDKLVSDRAKAEISKKVKDILRTLFIEDWQSEPYYHHQLFAERMIQELKKFANWVLQSSNAPPEAWYLVFDYVSFIMNRTAKESLNWRTPIEALTGQTPDISPLLHFRFWEPVFIKNYQGSGHKGFPSERNEIIVRFAGFAEGVGHSACYKVFNESTGEILYRSCLRKVDPEVDIVGVPPFDPDDDCDVNDEDIPEVIKVRASDEAGIRRSAEFSPDELIGRTFLMNVREDGQRFRAKILGYEKVAGYHDGLERQPRRIKFRCEVGDEKVEEYVEWGEMCEFIEEQVMLEDHTWRFRKICGYNKSQLAKEMPQVLIMWESGEITYEPIDVIAESDPYLLAEFARDVGKLDEWDKKIPRANLKRHAKNAKKLMRMINQAKVKEFREGPKYMYGQRVPRTFEEAMQFDRENGNHKWEEATKLELSQLFEYECFNDIGHKDSAMVPSDYKKIRLHLVYAVKHDRSETRRKA